MRAYYFDNAPGDQRLLHDSGTPVPVDALRSLGVLSWHIPVDADDNYVQAIDQIAREREYKNRDTINITKEGLGDAYEAKLKMFFEE